MIKKNFKNEKVEKNQVNGEMLHLIVPKENMELEFVKTQKIKKKKPIKS